MTNCPKILVVEDEVIARLAIVAMIQDAGYAVIEADNGAAAMQLLESQDGIRLMLTDIHMPAAIDGIMLAGIVTATGAEPDDGLLKPRFRLPR